MFKVIAKKVPLCNRVCACVSLSPKFATHNSDICFVYKIYSLICFVRETQRYYRFASVWHAGVELNIISFSLISQSVAAVVVPIWAMNVRCLWPSNWLWPAHFHFGREKEGKVPTTTKFQINFQTISMRNWFVGGRKHIVIFFSFFFFWVFST